jgi:cytidine deaminase
VRSDLVKPTSTNFECCEKLCDWQDSATGFPIDAAAISSAKRLGFHKTNAAERMAVHAEMVQGSAEVSAMMNKNLPHIPCHMLGSCRCSPQHLRGLQFHRLLMATLKRTDLQAMVVGDVLLHMQTCASACGASMEQGDHFFFVGKHIIKPARSILVRLTPCPTAPHHLSIARAGQLQGDMLQITESMTVCAELAAGEWSVFLRHYSHVSANVVRLQPLEPLEPVMLWPSCKQTEHHEPPADDLHGMDGED